MPILGTIASSTRQGLVTGSFESIATVVLTSDVSGVTFSGIPQTYEHLQLRASGRTNRAGQLVDDLRFNVNGVSGSGGHYHMLYGASGSVLAGYNNAWITPGWGAGLAGSAADANILGAAVIDILDYRDNNKNKTFRSLTGVDGTNGSALVAINTSLYQSTNSITSFEIVAIGSQIVSGSRFALYGIKA